MSSIITKCLFTLAIGISLTASQGAFAKETLRIAGNFVPQHSSSIAIEQFKQEVEKATNGEVSIQVFNAMQLGSAKENVTQVRAGTIAMTWNGMAYLSGFVPELEAVSLPFLFPNREVAYKVIDGKVGQVFSEKLAEKDFALLGFMELGLRQVTNSVRPLKTAADLQGLKIRLQPNETHLATFRALGANPLSMDIKELYSALEQGVVDGEENPYNLILASRFFEVQKYLSNTGHFFDFIAVVANKKIFDGLSPEHQQIIRTAVNNAVQWQREAAAKADIEALAELQKLGMQYDELPPSEREAMREASTEVINEIRARVGSDLVDLVLAEVKQASAQ